MLVEAYCRTGQPVGSKALASDEAVDWGPSTVRAEMKALEDLGFLTHPHTSSGRIPTDSGYRFYADWLLQSASLPAPPSALDLRLSDVRREVDQAMRATTSTLAQLTDLLALVMAPPLETTVIHRLEVLRLQPQVVMVVVITSTGGVTKRVISFDHRVDPGLVEWAATYLNERLRGMGTGARMIGGRLADPELGATEAGFIRRLAPAFTEIDASGEENLYVDGAARLLSEDRFEDVTQINELMEGLERRASLLGTLRSALDERSVYFRIGAESGRPEFRSVSLVAANYGLGYRNLGAVGVIGPLRMDYPAAIAAVRAAAGELSRFVESVYGE
jgi:heat-inducible transcriptional repressor